MGRAEGQVAQQESRTGRKRTQRIELLERTAARIFAERGYDGANFEQIAAELDLRGPSLYHYFSSKEELFLRCIRKAADDVYQRLEKIATSDLPPEERLRTLFREQVLIELRDYPEFVPLYFRTHLPVAELRDEVLRVRREHAALFEGIAEQIQRTEGLDRMQVRVWLATAFGALAYLPEWYSPTGELGVDQLAEKMADTLVRPFRDRD